MSDPNERTTSSTTVGPIPGPDGVDIDPRDVLLWAHNWVRTNNGVAPLSADPRLRAAAQGHADHMALTGRFGHSGVGDGDLASRLDAAGYRAGFAGENIAYGQPTPGDAVLAWWESPGHRANMLAGYRQAGFGYAVSASGIPYWVAVFGSPPT